MTAATVQATYDALDTVAAQFGQRAEASAALREQVLRGVAALEDGGWEGRGAAAFFAEAQGEILPALQRLQQALDQARAVTLEASAVLRAGEEEAAALFGGAGADRATNPQKSPAQEQPSSPPEVSGWRKGLAKALDVFTVGMDVAATTLSSVGGLAAAGLMLLDGPMPFGDAVAAVGYPTLFNPAENIVSGLGFASTTVSDILTGETYIDTENQEIVIGQDTLVSGTGIALGNLPPPIIIGNEPISDTIINGSILYYDIRGLMGDPLAPGGQTVEGRISYGDIGSIPYITPVKNKG